MNTVLYKNRKIDAKITNVQHKCQKMIFFFDFTNSFDFWIIPFVQNYFPKNFSHMQFFSRFYSPICVKVYKGVRKDFSAICMQLCVDSSSTTKLLTFLLLNTAIILHDRWGMARSTCRSWSNSSAGRNISTSSLCVCHVVL